MDLLLTEEDEGMRQGAPKVYTWWKWNGFPFPEAEKQSDSISTIDNQIRRKGLKR